MLIAQLSDLHVGGEGGRISVELCVPGGERWSLGDFPCDWPAELSARRSDPFVRSAASRWPHGEVQAVGGVTRKIEGFFATCKAKGLTGEQGVIIPRTNISNLMLQDEVVEAVQAGRFYLWAVETIDRASSS